ncbi:unnamed protein product, partial [Mesorhabditis belari]|uniref:Amino acid transporter n=1 Tax=Mesorhabditis belari TaxID=2138241 RepID=A0AAF3J6X5_9BILA
MVDEEPQTRSQKMGLLGAISYIIGNIVGSGIFITPTSILEQVNSVGLCLLIWILAAFISILGSFCYVELGTSIRISGADFAYICYVKWYPIAFAFMCVGCIITYPATLAVQAMTFSEYIFKGIEISLPKNEEYWAKMLLGFALIWILMFMNFFSLKTFVSRFQIAASVAKVAATGIVIVTGFVYLFQGKTKNFSEPFNGSTWEANAIVTALFAGLFSYDGWDILNFGAEEIEKPKRTMPLAIIIGMCSIALIYLAVNISYFTILDVQDFLDSPAVAQSFAEKTLGNFKYTIPFFVAILLVGSLNSTMFSASRYLQAASRQGHLPSFISAINPESDSPRTALFVHVLLAMAISFTGNVDSLINYVALAQWSQRAFTMVALMFLRFRGLPVHPDRIRNFILMPMVFGFVCWSLVIVTVVQAFTQKDNSDGRTGVYIIFGILALGLMVFSMFVFEKSLPSKEWWKSGSTKVNESSTKFAQLLFNVMPDLAQPGEDQMHLDEVKNGDDEGNGEDEIIKEKQRNGSNLNKVYPLLDGVDLQQRKTTTLSDFGLTKF